MTRRTINQEMVYTPAEGWVWVIHRCPVCGYHLGPRRLAVGMPGDPTAILGQDQAQQERIKRNNETCERCWGWYLDELGALGYFHELFAPQGWRTITA